MGSVHWLDALTPPLEQHLRKLVAAVGALVEVPISAGEVSKPPLPSSSPPEVPQLAEEQQRGLEAENNPRQSSKEVEPQQQVWEGQQRATATIRLEVGLPGKSETRLFVPGAGKAEWFKDLDAGPEMVVVPAGSFMMGSPESEAGRWTNEGPQHKVTFTRPFAVSRFAVTFDEWDACVAGGGNGYKPEDQLWGRGRRPVINVSWGDATAYCAWLAKKTGRAYRLLSEAECEYVTRAGTTTQYWWGPSFDPTRANHTPTRWARFNWGRRTLIVDSFDPNPWGLYQVHGNLWGWTLDVWHKNYDGAPSDGSAWTSGGDPHYRVTRGGAWSNLPGTLRSAVRNFGPPTFRSANVGFRLARLIEPAA
jgi:formylglycine-generating enzyme required for sulfatase activity